MQVNLPFTSRFGPAVAVTAATVLDRLFAVDEQSSRTLGPLTFVVLHPVTAVQQFWPLAEQAPTNDYRARRRMRAQ
jgi:hypothetical protein